MCGVLGMCGVTSEPKTIRIYSIVFHKNAFTLSTDDRDDFWLELHPTIGWVKFKKLRNDSEFTKNGALFVATELRSGSDSIPYPVFQARCVLWRQREALLSAANSLSFLLGQKHSD